MSNSEFSQETDKFRIMVSGGSVAAMFGN